MFKFKIKIDFYCENIMCIVYIPLHRFKSVGSKSQCFILKYLFVNKIDLLKHHKLLQLTVRSAGMWDSMCII